MPPDYAPAHRGVILSEALREAAVVAPNHRAMLRTFELWHPVATNEGPIYLVNDGQALLATKEAWAARDAGLEIEFFAVDIKREEPEESDTAATPEVSFSVGNVSGVMSDAIRRARGSLAQWEVIERLYASDDTSGPAILSPRGWYGTSVSINGEMVTLRASYGDSANVAVPRVTFKRREYSGLVR